MRLDLDAFPALPLRGPRTWAGLLLEDASPRRIGLALVGLVAVAYFVSNALRPEFYNHFVWQADAWLHGRFAIDYPVSKGAHQNWYFQDVMPIPGHPGLGMLPFPPLPAVVLLPLVAVLGFATPSALVSVALGALDVALAWRLCRRIAADRGVALAATAFFGFGTVAWYASAIGTTWFLAHVVALSLTFLAVTIALDGERPGTAPSPGGSGRAASPRVWSPAPSHGASRAAPASRRSAGSLRELVAPWSFVAGLLLGLAATSRLTAAFGAPFLLFVGGGTWRSRLVSAGLGVAIPLVGLAVYNLASTGHVFNPAYAWIAVRETHPIPIFWHPDWGLEDLRYVPQNLVIALLWPPQIHPECGLGLLDPSCGTVRPDPSGMSLLLTSPGWLLAIPPLRRPRVDRLATGSALTVLAIAVADLAHFSQGWVQFGWRFSNDFAPFALILVALTMARMGIDRRVLALVAASVLVNLWGVYWGVVLGW